MLHISHWAGTGEFLEQRNKKIALWSTWWSTNQLELLTVDSHICADDLAIYSQRKSSSTSAFHSSHTFFKASYLGKYFDSSHWYLMIKTPGESASTEQEALSSTSIFHTVPCWYSGFTSLPQRWTTKNKSHQVQGSGCLVRENCRSFLWHALNLFALCRIKLPLRGNQSQFMLAPHKVSCLCRVSYISICLKVQIAGSKRSWNVRMKIISAKP